MPNVIDIDPLRALAKRAGARIGDETVAKRFERIALAHLLKDPRNFREASATDIASAPAWAQEAAARGEEISVYKPNSALAARLHTVARRIARARELANADVKLRPQGAADVTAAREFILKFGRMNFEAAAMQALIFSRVLAAWQESDDIKSVCEPHSLVLLGGRIWHRVTSVAELRQVGREFRNCLAGVRRTSAYGSQLVHGHAQYWVLRDLDGRGLIVAMAPAPLATHFQEVKGPNNIAVRTDDADLMQLGIALGIRPRTPEPPPPPPPGIAAMLAAAAGRPCRCSLCDPLQTRRPLRLRRSSAAP